MNLADARPKMAALLAPVDDTDPNVLTSLSDAIEPPALMIGWAEPWIDSDGATPCFATAHLVVTCVAARLAPGDGIGTLETLVSYVLGRIKTDPGAWGFEKVSGPRVFQIAKTNYLAARVTVRVTVN